jgi:hypothetical protein
MDLPIRGVEGAGDLTAIIHQTGTAANCADGFMSEVQYVAGRSPQDRSELDAADYGTPADDQAISINRRGKTVGATEGFERNHSVRFGPQERTLGAISGEEARADDLAASIYSLSVLSVPPRVPRSTMTDASVGGADKDRMVQITTWLLGFSAGILSLHATGKLTAPWAPILLIVLGILVSALAAFVALLYGGYATWRWAIADQIATAEAKIAEAYPWSVLLPTNDLPSPQPDPARVATAYIFRQTQRHGGEDRGRVS